MKRILSISAVLLTSVSLLGQKMERVIVNGTVQNLQEGIIYITPFNTNNTDTLKIENGKFAFNGSQAFTQAYTYEIKGGESNILFLESGKHQMDILNNGSGEFTLTNAPAQNDINIFGKAITPFIQKRNEYASLVPNDSVNLLRNNNEVAIQNIYNDYIRNPKSNATTTAFLTLNNLQNAKNMGVAQMEALIKNLSKEAIKTPYGIKCNQFVNRYTADDIGKIAPDFTLVDANGKEVTLSEFRGKKFVLVDFWATWCGPCRGEFPHLKEAYLEYKDKGFEILAVSIDADKNKWMNMVSKGDATPWLHVYDGPGTNQVANTLYTVPSIPSNFLLDKSGKVVAKNLRGPGIKKTLEQWIK